MLPPILEPTQSQGDEKEPGVYVRTLLPDNELDVLWDRERKKPADHERFRLGYFTGGFLAGSILTLVVCTFLMPAQPFAMEAKPTIIQEEVLTEKDFPKAEATTPAPAKVSTPEEVKKEEGLKLPFFSSEQKDTPSPAKTAAATSEIKARVYEVQSGDNLGSIAIKFYNSSSPELIKRIQKANKMTDADTLSLGQRLVIPPKSY